MKTIKVIDLLNKIAYGEEAPKKIEYEGQKYKYNPINDYEGEKYGGCLLNNITLDHLNDEVEIIENKEDKKIKRIGLIARVEGPIAYSWSTSEAVLRDKINEIIDRLNGEEDE